MGDNAMTIGRSEAPYRCFAKLFATWSPAERLLRLGRIVYSRGNPGQPGGGYSAKLSLGLTPRLLRLRRGWHEWEAVLFGVRLHHKKSFGGWET